MATSTIIAFKDALITKLQARPGLAGVQVTWGIPPIDEVPVDWLYVGDAKSPADQEAAALGRLRREEHYVLHLEVIVMRPHADDPKTVATRAADIVEEVEDLLRTDPEVGGVVRVAQIVGVGLEEGSDGNERWAVMPVRIDVRQRI